MNGVWKKMKATDNTSSKTFCKNFHWKHGILSFYLLKAHPHFSFHFLEPWHFQVFLGYMKNCYFGSENKTVKPFLYTCVPFRSSSNVFIVEFQQVFV